jgi:hypothetical protein
MPTKEAAVRGILLKLPMSGHENDDSENSVPVNMALNGERILCRGVKRLADA